MTLKHHFEMMAAYNQWMNTRVYAASARLEEKDLHADKGAFFGSVFGTLDHLLVADTIWLKRFADHPASFRALDAMRPLPHPYSLTVPMHTRFDDLQKARFAMDDIIIALATEATDDAYAQTLTYANRAGEVFTNSYGELMQHVVNHQTHHRGQITTLLSQTGIDVGVTDLVAMVREHRSS
ncbi:MAG: DinB family protein [Dokdonella sp.]